MKKLAAIFLCACLMIGATACKSKDTPKSPELDRLFTCTAEMTYDKFEATATVNRLGNGLWDVEFSAPKTLSGVKLSYDGENLTAAYKGFTFTVPKDSLPIKNMLTLFFNAIDKNVIAAEMPCTVTDGVTTFTGESALGATNAAFSLSLDSSNKLLAFEMPDEKLSVVFSNYVIIQ